MKTIDTLLNIGCAFDWFTPLLGFAQDIFSGPACHFGIMANVGWGTSDIKRLFSKHGVRVWGLMYSVSGDMLMFSVRKTQAKWAYYLLQREGVSILYTPKEVIGFSNNLMSDIDHKLNQYHNIGRIREW